MIHTDAKVAYATEDCTLTQNGENVQSLLTYLIKEIS